MNIFFSTGMVCTKYGGLEKMIVGLTRELVSRSHGIFLQYEKTPESEEFIAEVEGAGGKIVVINSQNKFFKAAWEFYSFFRKNHIQIVHANFSPAKDCCVLAGRLTGVDKIFCHFHNVDTEKQRFGIKLWFVTRFSDMNVSVSEAGKRSIVQKGVPAAKVRVIYNGISIPDRKEEEDALVNRKSADQDKVIMCIAWDDPVKGVDLLLKAFSKVIEEDKKVKLWIVGSACDNPQNKAMSGSLGLEGYVEWMGVRNDIPDLLRECDVYVQPSRSESCSFSVLEAMGAGKAVAAFRAGGTPEIVDEGVTALIAEAEDTEALGSNLLKLLSDRGLRDGMGKAGYEKVLSTFSLERWVDDIVNLYGV